MLKSLPLFFRVWLYGAGILFVLTILIHGEAQQMLREDANSPQVQLAEDVATAMSAGANPTTLVPTTPVEISQRLEPFTVIYDKNGTILASNATLNGQAVKPIIPTWFKDSGGLQEDRVTWQPAQDVRIAAVIVPFHAATSSGYVLAGRSLREVEKLEDHTLVIALLAYGALLVVTFIGSWLLF